MNFKRFSFIQKNLGVYFLLISLFIVGLVLRMYGIFDNHPFWVDEFSSANQARLMIEHGVSFITNPRINIEYNNILNHFLIAISFKLFGHHEWVARLPFILIGSFVPVMIFVLARRLFNFRTALGASLLTTFSYFQITWSRQARGYILLELITLLTLYLYIRLLHEEKKQKIVFFIFFLSIGIGMFTHFAFYLVLITLIVHFSLTRFNHIRVFITKKFNILLLLFTVTVFYKIGIFDIGFNFLKSGIIKANNVWYYHAFLWREYDLITYLALLGLTSAVFKNYKQTLLFIVYISIYLFFFCFMFSPYVSRYVLPVFPVLFIYASFAICSLADVTFSSFTKSKTIQKYGPTLLSITLIGFIIINGDKFVIKPRTFYSVNHDFREIALIDYNQVYGIIKNKGKLEEGKTAVVDTWHDRLYWYLGTDFKFPYLFRWTNENGKINGLDMKTEYVVNNKNEKIIPRQKYLRYIGSFEDFKLSMAKYQRGFIFIDDSTLPKDVIEYAEKNLKKEISLDHYPLDDNPYSIWPATLYSWGIN